MSLEVTKSSILRAWGKLLRLPNLLTVPGDPLVGFLIVTKGNERGLLGVCAVAASLCFYTAGLIINDICDVHTDRRERPDRPLPSGQISPLVAAVVALALLGGGLGFCRLLDPQAWQIGLLLVVTIFLYDLGLKNIPILGPVTMGACRGLSVLLGGFAIPPRGPLLPELSLAVVTLTAYVAVVTHLARREMVATPVGAVRWAPAVVLAFGFVLSHRLHTFGSIPVWIGFSGSFLFAGMITLVAANRLEATSRSLPKEFKPRSVPSLIGLLLSSLLWIQASFIMIPESGKWSILIGLTLMGLWPLHRILDKQFHAS